MKTKIILGLLLLLSACDERQMETYENDAYLYFETTIEKDSIFYTFGYNPGVNEIDIPLEVHLIGRPGDADRELKLAIDTLLTTASPADYRLPEHPVFRKGLPMDTIYVRLLNTERLTRQTVTLVVKLVSNEYFTTGPAGNLRAKIVYNNIAAQPKWWDEVIERVYLGKYSEAKFREFIIATGVSDLTNLHESKIRALALQFKYYLQKAHDNGNPKMEADGKTEITVPVIG